LASGWQEMTLASEAT